MAEDYEVEEGDCISSIAFEHGFFWETLWNHPDNARLKQNRNDPNILNQGDVVHVPALTIKEESGATEQWHTFRRKSVPAYLRLCLIDSEERPRSNLKYKLNIDGDLHTGSTDGQGHLDQHIPPNARHALLTLLPEEDQTEDEEYEILLGYIDPLDEDSGLKQRLNNLGYLPDGLETTQERLRQAISSFQQRRQCQVTGQGDRDTREKLKDFHCC